MNKVITIISILLISLTSRVLADDWGPAGEVECYSPARKYMLKVQPDSDWPSKPGHCRATLFHLEPTKEPVWSRNLINNQAPIRVYVADSGEYVLTMDEWGEVGELPVVIYGKRGELIRVHNTDSLGLADDIGKIKQTVSSYWWNEDSINFFSPDGELFLMRLNWGKLIVLDLSSGNLVAKNETFYREDLKKDHEEKWKKLEEYRKEKMAEYVLRLLVSSDPHERKTGALISGQEKYTNAIPLLRKLLDDKESFSTNIPKKWTRVYFIRKAAKGALEAMGQMVENVVMEEPDTR